MTHISQDTRTNGLMHAQEIARLMTALDVDYDQLGELNDLVKDQRDELAATTAELDAVIQTINADAENEAKELQLDEYCRLNEAVADQTHALRTTTDELEELQEEASGFTDRDDVDTELREIPLSVDFRSDWTTAGQPLEAAEYAIWLTTGGPAARIRGELDVYGSPARAWLEVCDWGTPWTEVHTDHTGALLAFAQYIITC